MDIPFDRVIWDAADAAAYLKQSKAYFLRVTRYAAGFPEPIPSSDGGRPKWRALAVSEWALGTKEPT